MNLVRNINTRQEYQNRIEENNFKKNKRYDRFLNFPAAEDVEKKLLSGILNGFVKFETVKNLINSTDFFNEVFQVLFFVMEEMNDEGKDINLVSINDKLKAKHLLSKIGGQLFLLEITKDITPANYNQLCLIILEKSLIRNVTDIFSTNFYLLRDGANIVDIIPKAISELSNLNYKSEISNPDLDAVEFNKELVRRRDLDELRFYPTGLSDVDKKIIGFGLGNLNIIGAHPGVGKTSFMMQCAYNQAVKGNIPTCILSIEMQKFGIMSRLISLVKDVEVNKLLQGKVTDNEILEVNEYLYQHAKSKLFLEEKNINFIEDIIQKIKTHKKLNGVRNFYIDHHYAIDTRKKYNSKLDAMPYVIGELTKLAKEEDISITLLTQFNKDSKNRKKKAPTKDDLLGSKQIEMDAYLIILIDRPEADNRDKFDDKSDATNLAEFIVAKNRNSKLGTVRTFFRAEKMRFENLSNIVEPNNYEDYDPF